MLFGEHDVGNKPQIIDKNDKEQGNIEQYKTAQYKTSYCQRHVLQLGRYNVGFMPKINPNTQQNKEKY